MLSWPFGPLPQPPDWEVPWSAYQDRPWMRSMVGCGQSPVHHQEGDVWTHLGLVLQALVASSSFRALSEDERAVVFTAALLHDAAKPECTRETADGVTSNGHSRRGACLARELLWRAGVEPGQREQIVALIRHHMTPFWLIEDNDARERLLRISQTARCDHLAVLAAADARGRICNDLQRLLDNVELFREMAVEQGVLDRPYGFPSEQSRVTYFRKGGDPDRLVHSDPRCLVTVMSGLPAAGKDTWVAQNLSHLPCVSLDGWREALDVDPGEHQSAVIDAARGQARDLLRRRQSFVWNATNFSRELRGRCLTLFLDYSADIHIVYLEAPVDELERRNQARARPVPGAVVQRMLSRWEVPDLTEAHRVSWG